MTKNKASGVDVIKTYSLSEVLWHKKLECLSLPKKFRLSLKFMGKLRNRSKSVVYAILTIFRLR
jgi:hypothetical protein